MVVEDGGVRHPLLRLAVGAVELVDEFFDRGHTAEIVAREGLAECRSLPECDGRSEARTQGVLVCAAIRARPRTPPRGEQRGPATQPSLRQALRAQAP